MRYSTSMIPKIKENLSSYKPSGPIAGLPQAAVLILLHETSEDLNVIYCLRSINLPTHAGEVAFPGGKREEKKELQVADPEAVASGLEEPMKDVSEFSPTVS